MAPSSTGRTLPHVADDDLLQQVAVLIDTMEHRRSPRPLLMGGAAADGNTEGKKGIAPVATVPEHSADPIKCQGCTYGGLTKGLTLVSGGFIVFSTLLAVQHNGAAESAVPSSKWVLLVRNTHVPCRVQPEMRCYCAPSTEGESRCCLSKPCQALQFIKRVSFYFRARTTGVPICVWGTGPDRRLRVALCVSGAELRLSVQLHWQGRLPHLRRLLCMGHGRHVR